MKTLILAAAIASLGGGMIAAVPAFAKNHGMHAKAVEVVERDAKGRPSKVRVDGQDYTLCTSDNSDGCINPREAGLNWGNYTAKEWPGRPISRER